MDTTLCNTGKDSRDLWLVLSNFVLAFQHLSFFHDGNRFLSKKCSIKKYQCMATPISLIKHTHNNHLVQYSVHYTLLVYLSISAELSQ